MFLLYPFWILLTYLIGSMPFGLFVARAVGGRDPRTAGSGNVGATNIARLCGFRWGVATLALDLLKGLLPVAMATSFSDSPLFLSLVALAAILGHVFSVFLRFKGGKAVATTIGALIPLIFWPLLWSVLICVAVIKLSGFVSLGSLVLVVALPVFCLLLGQSAYLPLTLVILALVFWRHQDNIIRLAKGEEKPWLKKKS